MNSIIRAMFENEGKDVAGKIFKDMGELIENSLRDTTATEMSSRLARLAIDARLLNQNNGIDEGLAEELIVYAIYENLYDHKLSSFPSKNSPKTSARSSVLIPAFDNPPAF